MKKAILFAVITALVSCNDNDSGTGPRNKAKYLQQKEAAKEKKDTTTKKK